VRSGNPSPDKSGSRNVAPRARNRPVWETVARGAIADFRCASKLSGRKALRDSDDPQPLYPSRSPDEPSNKGLD